MTTTTTATTTTTTNTTRHRDRREPAGFHDPSRSPEKGKLKARCLWWNVIHNMWSWKQEDIVYSCDNWKRTGVHLNIPNTIHIHSHTHTYMHTCMCPYTYTHVHIQLHTHICSYMHTHTHTNKHADTHMHTYKHTDIHNTYSRTSISPLFLSTVRSVSPWIWTYESANTSRWREGAIEARDTHRYRGISSSLSPISLTLSPSKFTHVCAYKGGGHKRGRRDMKVSREDSISVAWSLSLSLPLPPMTLSLSPSLSFCRSLSVIWCV